MLDQAAEGGYALAAVNVTSPETLDAVRKPEPMESSNTRLVCATPPTSSDRLAEHWSSHDRHY